MFSSGANSEKLARIVPVSYSKRVSADELIFLSSPAIDSYSRYHRPYSFSHAICSDEQLEPHVTGAQLMLNDSVWRARCNARAGLDKCVSGWAYWICENTATRISNINPSFFDNNFDNNHIPLRYKISYKATLGSSKFNNTTTRNTAQQVIANHIAKLPIGSIYAFTDGSAKPNPGPTGAGIAVYRRTAQGDQLTSTYSFAIGHVDNNAGELFAHYWRHC